MVKKLLILVCFCLILHNSVYAADIFEELQELGDEYLENIDETEFIYTGDGINCYSNNIDILLKYVSPKVYQEVYEKVKAFVNGRTHGMKFALISEYKKRNDKGIYTFYIKFDYGWIYEIIASETKVFDMIVSDLKEEDLLQLEGSVLKIQNLYSIDYLRETYPVIYDGIEDYFKDLGGHARIIGFSNNFGIEDTSVCYIVVGEDVYKVSYTQSSENLDIREIDGSIAEVYTTIYKDERESVD